MQSTAARVGLLVALAAAAVVLFIVLSDDGDSGTESDSGGTTGTEQTVPAGNQPAEPAAPAIEVKNGQPVGGVTEINVAAGERVRFTVSSDVAEEVHVHGYDVSKPVPAGGTVAFDFPADLEGLFEVELEESATPIIELTVQPD